MNLELLSLFSLVLVLIYALIWSADLIEDSFVFFAKRIGVSEFFLGFVLLSAVSSLPEFAIVLSSNDTLPELAIGNLIGGALVLMTLVIGLTVIKFKEIKFEGRFKEKEVVMGLVVIFLSIVALMDGVLSIFDGVILLTGYLLYIVHLYYNFRSKKNEPAKPKSLVSPKGLLNKLFKAVIGAAIILVASSLIVDTIVEIGKRVYVNEAFIGLLILAVGTNLPEITILFRAKKASQKKLAIGNFIGSAAINSFFLGLLAILSQGVNLIDDAPADFIALVPVIVITAFAIFLFLVFSWTGHRLTRVEGAMLVGVYGSLIVTELLVVLDKLY